MQISAVPVILSLQNLPNFKHTLLTSSNNPSNSATQSMVLTIGSHDNARGGRNQTSPSTDNDAHDSPSSVSLGNDSPSPLQISSRAHRKVSAVRTIQPISGFKSIAPSNVRRLANFSLVKNLNQITPFRAGDISVASVGNRIVSLNAVPVVSTSEVSRREESERLNVEAVSNPTDGDNENSDEDAEYTNQDIYQEISRNDIERMRLEKKRIRLLTSNEMKDCYKTTPLKKRPLILSTPQESDSSSSDDDDDDDDAHSSSQLNQKNMESKMRNRRKPKNDEVKRAERFVMVNRGVLEGLMDHVKSSAEMPFEEKELARKFQKDRIKKCDYCDRTFNYFSKLVEHIRSHTKIRPYVCRICSSRFKYKGDLMVHIKQHSDDRPYSCDCGRRFATKKYLNVHIRQAAIMGRHPAARPFSRRHENQRSHGSSTSRTSSSKNRSEGTEFWLFECQECGRRFTSKVSLLEHVREHTKLEPVFECNSCGVKFEDSKHFERHMSEHN